MIISIAVAAAQQKGYGNAGDMKSPHTTMISDHIQRRAHNVIFHAAFKVRSDTVANSPLR